MAQGKKDNPILKTALVAILVVGGVLTFFNHLSNRSSVKRTESVKSEVELLSEYNMVAEYPNTPRDVVKLHSRFFELFYGTKLTDKELEVLNQQVRYLYTTELRLLTDENTNLVSLKNNIENMKDANVIYKSYELPEPSQIIYYTQNGKEMATLEVKVTLDMKESMG